MAVILSAMCHMIVPHLSWAPPSLFPLSLLPCWPTLQAFRLVLLLRLPLQLLIVGFIDVVKCTIGTYRLRQVWRDWTTWPSLPGQRGSGHIMLYVSDDSLDSGYLELRIELGEPRGD